MKIKDENYICDWCGEKFNYENEGIYFYPNYDFDNDGYTENWTVEMRDAVKGKCFCCQECECNFLKNGGL